MSDCNVLDTRERFPTRRQPTLRVRVVGSQLFFYACCTLLETLTFKATNHQGRRFGKLKNIEKSTAILFLLIPPGHQRYNLGSWRLTCEQNGLVGYFRTSR
jgi:hypothetical protein